jgi:hypothetical protein
MEHLFDSRTIVLLASILGFIAGTSFGAAIIYFAYERFAIDRALVVDGNARRRDPMILIIDDERVLRQAFARYLREAGYEVAEARDGAEGAGFLLLLDLTSSSAILRCRK